MASNFLSQFCRGDSLAMLLSLAPFQFNLVHLGLYFFNNESLMLCRGSKNPNYIPLSILDGRDLMQMGQPLLQGRVGGYGGQGFSPKNDRFWAKVRNKPRLRG